MTPADHPRPSNWQDFERLSHALFSQKYGTRFRRWGKAVERSDGVDAWAKLDDGRVVALHCKGRTEHYSQPLTQADVDAALAQLASFPHPIDEFFLLAAAPDDPAIAAHAGAQVAARPGARPAAMQVWGWPTICRQVGQYPKVRNAFFGHDVRSSGKHKLALLAAAVFVVAGGAGSLFLGKNAIDSAQVKPPEAAANEADVVRILDELEHSYRRCEARLGGSAFTFSRTLVEDCRDPAADSLKRISKKVDKLNPGLDTQLQAELARLLAIFHEDAREAAAVATATYAFESEVVRSMKDTCRAAPATGPGAVRDAGVAAVTAQVRYYFLLRDFILPEMEIARSLLALHVRQDGAPMRDEMKVTAQRMEQLLTARSQYALKEAGQPFALSAVKRTAARDATIGNPDPADEAGWRAVLAEAPTNALQGRAGDLDALIACGALTPAARAWAQPKPD